MVVDIVTENARTQGRLELGQALILGHGDINAQGFTRKPSVNVGETVQFSCDGNSTVIDIYRVGYYGGQNLRLIASIPNTPSSQPELVEIPNSNGATTATAWSITASWSVPEDAVSGFYLALVRSIAPYAPNAFWIPFVVRDDEAEADMVYVTSWSTWGMAYNHYGTKANINGKNLYGSGTGVGNINSRSLCVSSHRPIITRGTVSQTYWYACEMPMISFLERNGVKVKYATSEDLDRMGVSLFVDKCNVYMSNGHDEYWSREMREAVESWRDNYGGLSIFMSGNEVFWKSRTVRVGDEVQIWCFKDTMGGPSGYSRSAGQPFDPVEWTGTWMDTRWPQHRDGALLTGTKFGMNGVYDYDAVIPKNPYGGIKVWGGSSLVDAPITLTRVIGFEADHLHPTQPGESVKILAAYTRAAPGGLSDANGENYNVPGNIEWGIIAQRYAGGGLTVGFGTCQWAWALDDRHDRGSSNVSLDAQKFTINLLRDLGAPPYSLMPGISVRPKNDLNEYGLVPGGVEPPPVIEETNWFAANGTPMIAYTMIDGELKELIGSL